MSAVRCCVMTSSACSAPSSIANSTLSRSSSRGGGVSTGDVRPPVAELLATRGGDRVALLAVGLVAGDQAVPLQAIEGRVHLPDVEGPRAAGRRLEGGLQLVAVARTLRQQGQEPFPHRHGYRVCILEYALRQGGAAERRVTRAASPIGPSLDRMTSRRCLPALLVGLSLLAGACATEADPPAAADDHHVDHRRLLHDHDRRGRLHARAHRVGRLRRRGLRHPRGAPRLRGPRRRARSRSTPCAPRPPASARGRCSRTRADRGPAPPSWPRSCRCSSREINEHFDIVGVDPRGVGGSTPIDCGVDATELYGVDPTIEDARGRGGVPRGQRGVRRRLRRRSTATCSRTSARGTSPATWTRCGPRWATSS